MASFDASTPRLKIVKKLLEAYTSLDIKNVEPLLSKDYQYEALPASADIPKQTKESHLQTWGKSFSPPNKFEIIYHEVIEAPEKVVVHFTGVLSTISGTTLNLDTILIYTFVEEDGELKILHCKDFGDPQQRGVFIAGTLKGAAERVAA